MPLHRRYNPDGSLSTVFWKAHPRMTQRIPDFLLDRVAFLYPTEAEAKAGTPTGGSVFFVGVPWETRPDISFVYGVTNRHVIEPKTGRSALVVRAHLRGGGTDTILSQSHEWHS